MNLKLVLYNVTPANLTCCTHQRVSTAVCERSPRIIQSAFKINMQPNLGGEFTLTSKCNSIPNVNLKLKSRDSFTCAGDDQPVFRTLLLTAAKAQTCLHTEEEKRRGKEKRKGRGKRGGRREGRREKRRVGVISGTGPKR